MPRNRVHKLTDGRLTYSAIDRSGRRVKLNQRKKEGREDFLKRCSALDISVRNFGTSGLTMSELFDMWMEMHVEINLSPAEKRVTEPIYENKVKPYLGRKKISEIERADVYAILALAQKEGCSASYIKKIRGCISRPYNWATRTLGLNVAIPTQGLIFSMPTEMSANTGQPERVIEVEDLERFLTAAKNAKYYNYYVILSQTGLRPSEGLGLQINDITRDRLLIRRGITADGFSPLKTKSSKRDIPLTETLRKALNEQKSKAAFRSEDGWLFPSGAGPPSMKALHSSFKRTMKQVNKSDPESRVVKKPVDFVLYDFRHTFATKAAEAGMPPKTLQAIMGHSDIATTLNYYVSVTEKMMDQARRIMEAL